MKKKTVAIIVGAFFLGLLTTFGARAGAEDENAFDQASQSIQHKLESSIEELAKVRERAAEEKIPLSRRLSELESELGDVRLEYQKVTRAFDSGLLDQNNLRAEIKSRQEEGAYLSTLFGEYIRNFESRLHISEVNRYEESLEDAKLAAENTSLAPYQVYQEQAKLLTVALERLGDALGGTKFAGAAVAPDGEIKNGNFILVGPVALFRAHDGSAVGTVEQRLGSLEPSVMAFESPADASAATTAVAEASGRLPIDPTLGNAHKVEQTEQTLAQEVAKGGPVMVPIFALAGAAFIVALWKWVGMLFVRRPSQKKIRSLLDLVRRHERKEALDLAKRIGGPTGRMLTAGCEHLKEPRELIEEVMYETVLATRLKLERLLPFIAISASAAPLLGLLGTVTGIINTFKLITVFGSGDVKMLSGGISEALITTKYGLIVAIPSLLLHAFLARKARGIINQMEKVAIAFMNQVSKTPYKNTYFQEESKDDKQQAEAQESQTVEMPADTPQGDLLV